MRVEKRGALGKSPPIPPVPAFGCATRGPADLAAAFHGDSQQGLCLPGGFGKRRLLRRALDEAALVGVFALLAEVAELVVRFPVDLLEPQFVVGVLRLLVVVS